MVVTGFRKEAVRYKVALDKYIDDAGYSGLGALVAFSGEVVDALTSRCRWPYTSTRNSQACPPFKRCPG